jgi:hypothetical protein
MVKQQLARLSGSVRPLLLLIAVAVAAEFLAILAVARPLFLGNHNAPADYGLALPLFLGESAAGLWRFLAVSIAAIGLYLAGYLSSRRCAGKAALFIVLGSSAVFACTLLAAYPAGSADVFTNILDGRMRWVYGLNPLVSPPSAVSFDPLYPHLVWQNEPTYYGPLWYWLLFVPSKLSSGSVARSVVAFRLVTIPFLAGSAYLTARIASRRSPGLAPAAALAVGWCPLLLWETSVNGHNDIVMAFFAVFALERALAGSWRAAIPLLALSILTKYLSAVMAPLFLVAALRSPNCRHRRDLAIGVGASVLLAVAAYWPFWHGLGLLRSMLGNGSPSFGLRLTNSPSYLLTLTVHHIAGRSRVNPALLGGYVKAATLIAFTATYLVLLKRAWQRRYGLAEASYRAVLLYLILISWWFWPWYLTLLVALAAASIAEVSIAPAIIFSSSTLCGYALLGWVPVLARDNVDALAAGSFCVAAFLPLLLYILVRRGAKSVWDAFSRASAC